MKIRHAIAALIVPLGLLASGPAQAVQPTPVSDIKAFSVSPGGRDCTAGSVHVNYVEGIDWYVDEAKVLVVPPYREFQYPEGARVEVVAVPQDGYAIAPDTETTIHLEVAALPASCGEAPEPEPVTTPASPAVTPPDDLWTPVPPAIDNRLTRLERQARNAKITRLIHAGKIGKAMRLAKPCEYEDSNNCAWDAKSRGNERGHSFITWRWVVHYANGEVLYLKH